MQTGRLRALTGSLNAHSFGTNALSVIPSFHSAIAMPRAYNLLISGSCAMTG
jgi:hypothetical protein